MKPLACVTIDLDPLAGYLKKRGLAPKAGSNLNAVYDDGLPRFLDLLATRSIPATFFAVASDALNERNAAGLRRAAAQGHEIACHGYRHDVNLGRLAGGELRQEVLLATRTLSDAMGKPVLGFRAPGWNVGRELFELLLDMDYRYDSSLVPAPLKLLLPMIELAMPRLLPSGIFTNQRDWPVPPPYPYRFDPQEPWRNGNSAIWEIPAGFCALPPVPLNGTVSAKLGGHLGGIVERLSNFSPYPLVLILHGLDLTDFHSQIRDERLSAKPGLMDSLEEKLRRIGRILDNIGRGRHWLRLMDIVSESSQSPSF